MGNGEGDDVIDYGDYPRINAAAIADFYVLDDGRIRFVFYDFWRCEGKMRKRVCGEVTLQLSIFISQRDSFRKALDAAIAMARQTPVEHPMEGATAH